MGGKHLKLDGESPSDHAIRTLCYGAILKARHPKGKNAVATRNDQLLSSAGASKRSYAWFNKMGISNAYSTKVARSGDFGKGYDTQALRWKAEIEKDYSEIKTIQESNACSFKEATEIRRLTNPLPFLYKIIGDNLDIEKTARHQGIKNRNTSLHWFHYMAVLHRLHSTQANRTLEEYQKMPIFPNSDTQDVLSKTFKILIARSIVTFIPAFKFLRKNVCWHIPHDFWQEMAQKSIVVPLGLLFHAENSTSEIIQILKKVQEGYVPMATETDEDGEIIKHIIFALAFGGDQLTEERIFNAQQGFIDARNDYEMLQGLKPAYEDWHLKRTLYEVKETIFRTRDSGAQHGTTQWNMNVSDNSNAKKGAKEDFNAVKEFTDIETDSLIVSAAMTHFGMNKIDDDIIPKEIKDGGEKEKFEWLQGHVEEIFNKYTATYDIDMAAGKEISKPDSNEIKNITLYFCGKCPEEKRFKKPFKTAAGRNKHEQKKHSYQR
ncbi:uncharacterized protein [Clytia hemisphaerica]|uniref:uncharacterized protein n=1 Tax=Clytia hemisphaerica TaxID=252671 RepID=UPI0034D70231